MAAYLKIIQGVGQGQVLAVPEEQPVTLGRSSQATYAFDDALLSRKHCQIESRGDVCRVTDLQSRNGTYVNGQRIAAQLVKMGDRVKIGSLLMEIAPLVQAAPPPPNLVAPPPVAPVRQVANCEACKAPLGPKDGRTFKNHTVCPRCLDRYDVDENLIEGFQILERLSAHGASSVYKAKQLLMERLVMLKTIVASTDTDEKDLRRFMREAKTGGRLSHPSIIELYDVNETEGLMYIVMEFVEGDSLEQLLRARKTLPAPQALRYMVHVAEALKCAHEQSIIHRDVRPAAIQIRREDDRAKLGDFALAKNLERAISVITGDGEAVGTPFYMSPEQVKNAKGIDVRSDIYSFGAVFYQVLVGTIPIPARSYGEFLGKVFTVPPVPFAQAAPAVPPKIAAVIEKCLAKEPAQRFQEMEQVALALEAIAEAAGVSVT